MTLHCAADGKSHLAYFDLGQTAPRGAYHSVRTPPTPADFQIALERNGSGDLHGGDTVSYTVTVNNIESDGVADALVTGSFSPTVAVESLQATPFAQSDSCQINQTGFTCQLDNVDAQERTITVTATIAGDYVGQLELSSSVAAGENVVEQNDTNNQATPMSVTVLGQLHRSLRHQDSACLYCGRRGDVLRAYLG